MKQQQTADIIGGDNISVVTHSPQSHVRKTEYTILELYNRDTTISTNINAKAVGSGMESAEAALWKVRGGIGGFAMCR